jgi:hypothetical protein
MLDDEIIDGKPWYYDIRNFVEDRTLSRRSEWKE